MDLWLPLQQIVNRTIQNIIKMITFILLIIFLSTSCAMIDPIDKEYEIVRKEIEINKIRISKGLKPIWTYK